MNIPVVAIGGINLSNLEEVLATGVDGVAVVSAIVGAESVREATRSFRQKLSFFGENHETQRVGRIWDY